MKRRWLPPDEYRRRKNNPGMLPEDWIALAVVLLVVGLLCLLA